MDLQAPFGGDLVECYLIESDSIDLDAPKTIYLGIVIRGAVDGTADESLELTTPMKCAVVSSMVRI